MNVGDLLKNGGEVLMIANRWSPRNGNVVADVSRGLARDDAMLGLVLSVKSFGNPVVVKAFSKVLAGYVARWDATIGERDPPIAVSCCFSF